MAASLIRGAVLLAGCVCTAILGDACAQFGAADRAAYMAGVRIDRQMLAGGLATIPRSAMSFGVTSDQVPHETREVNLFGNGVVLEVPRVAPDGSFQRPRVMIGRQSPELRLWMKEAGIDTDRCMLPMLRSRLKREPGTGKLSAAMLVSARCTFY